MNLLSGIWKLLTLPTSAMTYIQTEKRISWLNHIFQCYLKFCVLKNLALPRGTAFLWYAGCLLLPEDLVVSNECFQELLSHLQHVLEKDGQDRCIAQFHSPNVRYFRPISFHSCSLPPHRTIYWSTRSSQLTSRQSVSSSLWRQQVQFPGILMTSPKRPHSFKNQSLSVTQSCYPWDHRQVTKSF